MGTDIRDKQARLDSIRMSCRDCRRCSLCKTRTQTVFGTGNPDATLMFVGEAPGRDEDAQGEPFVGAAGQLLDRYLFAVDIPRSSVYIANILKCRPPQNRDPLPEEADSCMDFLRAQISIIRPRIIVCLGRISAARLIRPDYRITREHGQFVTKGSFLLTAVYHPSALLRDPSKKEAMLTDMEAVKARLDACRDATE